MAKRKEVMMREVNRRSCLCHERHREEISANADVVAEVRAARVKGSVKRRVARLDEKCNNTA